MLTHLFSFLGIEEEAVLVTNKSRSEHKAPFSPTARSELLLIVQLLACKIEYCVYSAAMMLLSIIYDNMHVI